jgi:hypothetical protein
VRCAAERTRRQVGRPSKADGYRDLLVQALMEEPTLRSVELLHRARQAGYTGGKRRTRLRPLKIAPADLALRIPVSVSPMGVVMHDGYPHSMPPNAIGLPGTQYLYRNRVRIVAGRGSAAHERNFSPAMARCCGKPLIGSATAPNRDGCGLDGLRRTRRPKSRRRS